MKEVIDIKKIKLALSDLKIREPKEPVRSAYGPMRRRTENYSQYVQKERFEIPPRVVSVTSFAAGYTGWLVGGLASISLKAIRFTYKLSFAALSMIVASASRSINRRLDKGFIDYDWSNTRKSSDSINSGAGFKHTTRYQDITITVEKP